MSRGHRWGPAGCGMAGAECRDCGKAYDGLDDACLSPRALRRRAADLYEAGRQLADDLRDARAGAPAGEKGAFRYPLRHLETALPLIGKAAGHAR